MLTYKERVVAIYQAHDPTKVPKVDALLKQYEGKEEAYIKALLKKYNAEAEPTAAAPAAAAPGAAASTTPRAATAAASPPAAAAASGAASYKDRLLVILNKYEPEKVGKADAYLKQYEGKEEALIKSMCKKHGEPYEAPKGAGNTTPRDSKPDPAPAVAPATTPRAAEPAPATAAPAATASGSASSFKDRLLVILQKYEPEKVGKADAFLKQYEGKEEALIKSLCKKHNEPYEAPKMAAAGAATPRATETAAAVPAATSTAAAAAAASPPAAAAAANAPSYKDRLLAILTKYEPEKVGKADAYLKQYEGKEEALIKSMCKKHGEPYEAPKGAGNTTPRDSKPDLAPAAAPATTPRAAEPAPPAAAAAAGGPLSYEQRVALIFAKHEPEKVSKAARFLAQYAGKEEQFIKSLAKKYNDPDAALPRGPTMPAAGAAAASAPAAAEPAAPAPAAAMATAVVLVSQPLMHVTTAGSDEAMATPENSAGVSGSTTPGGAMTPRATSHADAPRHMPELNVESTAVFPSGFSSSSSAAPAPAPAAGVVVSKENQRKLDRVGSLGIAAATQFYHTKVEGELKRRWFALWRTAGQKKVAARVQAATKSDRAVPGALVDALGECRISPGAWARIRFLREQLQLPIAVPTDVAGVALAIDECIKTAFEFVTETHERELQQVQEDAAGEMQKLMGVLQKAHQTAADAEQQASKAADRAKLLELHLQDAEHEVEQLRGQLDAQCRLTQRAHTATQKLQAALEREQRGVPSDLEQRLEQKDELAVHLHKQLAAARSGTNGYKEQCERLMAELGEERDRRTRAEQRIEVLSVALLPPEALGVKEGGGGGGGGTSFSSSSAFSSVARGQSIAESVRNARAAREHQLHREQQHQAEFHLSDGSSSGGPRPVKTYAEQAQLLAAARKAMKEEGTAIGGDVPRKLLAYHGRNSAGGAAAAASSSSAASTPRDPSPPAGAPPAGSTRALLSSSPTGANSSNRAGLNQTPALEAGASPNNNNNSGSSVARNGSTSSGVMSPSPSAPAASHADPAAAAADSHISSDPLGHVNCPNCETVKLTAFNGARFSTNPTDKDKVAFCFSCRKTFSMLDLEQMMAAKAKAAAKSESASARGVSGASTARSVGRGGGGGAGGTTTPRQTFSQQRAAKIPEHLKNSVAKLQSHRAVAALTTSSSSAAAAAPPSPK